TRSEVGDAQGIALDIDELGLEDGRVGNVGLPRHGKALEFDRERAGRGALVAGQQGVEYRIAVRSRQATPDDTPARVDKRVEGAVADDSERKIALRGGAHAAAPRLGS